jgi:hypothetical protein
VLSGIREVLVPNGLFFLGVYSGDEFEGTAPDDWHTPPRFFSFRTDEQIRALVSKEFATVDFHVVEPEEDAAVARSAAGHVRFQSFTLRRVD